MILTHSTATAMLAAMEKHVVTGGSPQTARELMRVATAMLWAACIELVH